MDTSRDSRGSIIFENSSIRKRELQNDREFNIALINRGKWEKSAQIKLSPGSLEGAQHDLRNALDCRDRIYPEFANNRELVVLQKLIDVGGRHIELSQSEESELLFRYAVDRGSHISADTSDSLRAETVAKAAAIALANLKSCDLPRFERFSRIVQVIGARS